MTHTHVYAGDPLDRVDRERRDPQWIEAHLGDPGSRFLPLIDLRPLG